MSDQSVLFTFIDRINGDSAFIERLKVRPQSEWLDEIRALGRSEGVEFEDDEYYAALKIKFSGELSEDQLDQVSGGTCCNCAPVSPISSC